MGIQFERVIKEMCQAFGLQDPSPILGGGKLQVDDFFITFIHDEQYRRDRLYVYFDLGKTEERDVAKVYKALLKMNFEMEGGECGSMSLHPENEHVFYSFFYVLDENATGVKLLSTIMNFVSRGALDAFSQPKDAREVHALAAAASGRARVFAPTFEPK